METKYFGEFRDVYSKASGDVYSQFKKEVHPMEKYIGRLARCTGGKVLEVVGYRDNGYASPLIVDASKSEGCYWESLDPQDVVVKKCERYWYVSVDDLID